MMRLLYSHFPFCSKDNYDCGEQVTEFLFCRNYWQML